MITCTQFCFRGEDQFCDNQQCTGIKEIFRGKSVKDWEMLLQESADVRPYDKMLVLCAVIYVIHIGRSNTQCCMSLLRK